MVDPFFQNTNTNSQEGSTPNNGQINVNAPAPQNTPNQTHPLGEGDPSGGGGNNAMPTTADQIKKLNEQQQQIQAKYQELKNLYENQKLTVEQKQQVSEQMQKLSGLYTQNKQTLAMLSTNIAGEKEIHVNKDVVVKEQKKRKKLSFRGIAIGCSIVFIFLIGGLAAVFYYLIQNPSQLSSVGIDPNTATQLLQTFATIFFGLLFFASLGLLIVNFYRLTTSKNKRKFGYVIGIIFGFLLLVGTLIGGARILDMLRNISVDDFIDSNSVMSVFWQEIGPVDAEGKPTVSYARRNRELYPLIAPANIGYQINTNVYEKQILPQLGDVQVVEVSLDCGNGQVLSIDANTAQTQGSCFYESKGNYPLKLTFNYIDQQTSEQLTKDIPAGELPILSQIEVRTNQEKPSYSKNQIIVGVNPVKVTYDSSDVFVDLGLQDYKINWYVDGGLSVNKSDLSVYTHLYTGAGVYYVRAKYPDLNDHAYVFPVRVEQSDVPVAQINHTAISETEYNISAIFFGTTPDISEYVFNILDKQTTKQIDSITSKTPSINYTFPGNGIYAVQIVFVTEEGKQGTAESEDINIGGSQFQIIYDVFIKTPTTPQFEKVESLGDIELNEIPTILKLEITNIIPTSPTVTKQVFVDGSPVVSTDDSFQTTIDSNKDYNLKIVVEDPNRDAKTEKEIKVSVKRDDIIGNLLVSPDTVGTSPFQVKFDASTTTINDPQDEIVYFTWDFGDGEVKENLSQSIISHTYNYDFDNENGEYFPKVTIKTKKGRELVIGSGTMILVKKPNVTLNIEIVSHPAQIASAGEKVDMSLDIDGLPETIVRDFGNGNTLECGGRECTETSQIYNTPGEYTIGAQVTYPDKPTIEGKINLVVR